MHNTIVDPEGNTYISNNMKKFSQEHNLTARLMTSVSQGKYKRHKGWTVVSVEKL